MSVVPAAIASKVPNGPSSAKSLDMYDKLSILRKITPTTPAISRSSSTVYPAISILSLAQAGQRFA